MKQKLIWFIQNFEEVAGALLLFSMVSLAFANVVMRYLLDYSFAFTEELEVSGMVWLTMIGTAAAFKHNVHLRLMYLDDFASPLVKKALYGLMILSSIALFSILGYLSLEHVNDLIELEVTTEALELPEWWYVLAIPTGCALINLRLLEQIFKSMQGQGAKQ